MHAKDFLDLLAVACALAVAVTVGRTNIKKQAIADLLAANAGLRERVDILEVKLQERDARIEHLEETIDGYAELVREGHLAGSNRKTSRNRTASP